MANCFSAKWLTLIAKKIICQGSEFVKGAAFFAGAIVFKTVSMLGNPLKCYRFTVDVEVKVF